MALSQLVHVGNNEVQVDLGRRSSTPAQPPAVDPAFPTRAGQQTDHERPTPAPTIPTPPGKPGKPAKSKHGGRRRSSSPWGTAKKYRVPKIAEPEPDYELDELPREPPPLRRPISQRPSLSGAQPFPLPLPQPRPGGAVQVTGYGTGATLPSPQDTVVVTQPAPGASGPTTRLSFFGVNKDKKRKSRFSCCCIKTEESYYHGRERLRDQTMSRQTSFESLPYYSSRK